MNQQEFWNTKFSKADYFYGINPNEFLASNMKILENHKKLLCLGEGEGRNALFFAKNGFDVSAIDASNLGLEKLKNRAIEEKLDIQTICMDLNDWTVLEKYDVIVASYLHMYKNEREELFKKIENSLNTNGYFIGEFFSTKQLTYNSGGPKDLDLLYTVEDFMGYFNLCEKNITEEIVILDEGIGHQGEACVIRVKIKKV
ncbi:MAG: methyltransferase domain-containing protein [Arcobacter sp.]|jgi:SAM-dependent methyltransferase|uniref:class I SAM-dependent methyltransferase n=1 Tax=Arcobacter sp. TaxID=1872629 RepID=UPI002A74CD52|nr:methyltransferase domain-containing protein [Arcobacter sp.]MDY3203589.1 methyltransferase domain-containing protein [Arcobacter sp.]